MTHDATRTNVAGTGTVTLHRVLRTTPAKLYRAFLEPDAYARWLPPNGYCAKVLAMDPVVGGAYRMVFINFGTGHRQAFGGVYRELVPDRRIRHSAVFDAPGPAGEMETTVELEPSVCGTTLRVVQSGIPAEIPVDGCYLGWQQCLEHLARLVEPEIPD